MQNTEPGDAFSFTRISTYFECPRKYQYRYIEKRPETFTAVELYLGEVIHSTLHWLYDVQRMRKTVGSGHLLDVFAHMWSQGLTSSIRVVKRNESMETHRGNGLAMLSSHYHDVFLKDRRDTVGLEQDFALRLGQRHEYVGVIDRLARDHTGTLHVVDFKTTGRPPKQLDEENALQNRSYGVATIAKYTVDRVNLEYQYLRTSGTLTETFTRADARTATTVIVRRIDEIQKIKEFFPKPSVLCEWCGYSTICPQRASGSRTRATPRCPLCGASLAWRKGRGGSFLGCSRFPFCRYSRNP